MTKLIKSERTKHDELFKVMVGKFLYLFLQGFFPWLAVKLVQDYKKPLNPELFGKKNLRKRQADLVFEMRSKEGWEVIIHIERQSQRVTNYSETMFDYNSRLTEEYRPKRVISIVVYGHDCKREEADNFQLEVFGFKVWDFRFLRLQLNKLDWQEYENCLNPVVAAMLSRMVYRPEERVDVKLAHLRTLAKLDLSEEDVEMFMAYFDTYLELSIEEKLALKKRLGEDTNEEGLKMIRYMTSYHKDGIKEGIVIGKKDLAGKLLEMGKVTIKDLVEATNLPEEELERLLANG